MKWQHEFQYDWITDFYYNVASYPDTCRENLNAMWNAHEKWWKIIFMVKFISLKVLFFFFLYFSVPHNIPDDITDDLCGNMND